ncbi:O-linked N-acetylglucosamine transferase, SPINDLY family protein [Thiorhodovibrio frisius]|uniref:protein O-GlcNAc transferase n=1 Tax=Thiorhodovibrio frisius TaxID=631362 RepID=H8Z5B5_9GAMM|nr:glycosyltransferase family 41 protein [Thiorhodovibrio frisius]EIC20522.1 putative O-linked N-acetylglucosamine transferase, SPINDLY family [Thiorhodovibrio frisius]WPL21266.1 TPR repeat-containing protein YrrB [Thiorhodovibrio frisius]
MDTEQFELETGHLDTAIQYHQRGEIEGAILLYQQFLRVHPRHADAWYLLSLAAYQAEQYSDAENAISEAISLNPTDASYHAHAGELLKSMGKLEEALANYRTAAGLAQTDADLYLNIGIIFDRLKRFSEAIHAYDRALRYRPNHPETHFNRGRALMQCGRERDAVSAFDAALACREDYAKAYHCRGLCLDALKRPEDALAAFDAALSVQGNLAESHFFRGTTLLQLGRLHEAVDAFETALKLAPDFAEAHFHRGSALQSLGRKSLGPFTKALAAYDAALAVRADYAEALHNRATTLQDLERLDEAIAGYTHAISVNPNYLATHSNRLLALHYRENSARGPILSAARQFGERFGHHSPRNARAKPHPKRRPLCIGYVSGDFRRHPVGHFLEPLLPNHDRKEVRVICFPTSTVYDSVSAELQSHADGWHSLVGLDDETAADCIRAQSIDILLDLSGHTADNRLSMFALKPAPVQASWLGYVGTTGLSAMDYVLADRFVAPEQDKDLFIEQLWRLPHSYMCIRPPEPAVPIRKRNANPRELTFGSFNNTIKLSPATIALWSHILRETPNTRLLLRYASLRHAEIRRQLLERFAAHGISAERLTLEGKASRTEMLETYNRVDIALDPTPYGGGITTAEALWMGVPVITLHGGAWPGRHSASILNTIGCPGLVAKNEEEYVALAISLATAPQRRRQYHETLRSTVEQSPLCDGLTFARDVETAFRGMWDLSAGIAR